MRNRFNRRGQALVELAFLFPVMLFVFLIFAQLLRVVITQVWIHQSSGQLAYRIATGASAKTALKLEIAADFFHLRHAANPDPRTAVSTELLQGWKKYGGVGTFDQPPHLIRAKIVFDAYSHSWYSWTIPWMTMSAQTECPEDVDLKQAL